MDEIVLVFFHLQLFNQTNILYDMINITSMRRFSTSLCMHVMENCELILGIKKAVSLKKIIWNKLLRSSFFKKAHCNICHFDVFVTPCMELHNCVEEQGAVHLNL